MTDLCNEVKFFAIQCLTTLMDIFPQVCNSLVNAGLVKGVTTCLRTFLGMGFIDLAEACIKAYERIVVENPPAVLKSGAIAFLLEQIDFLDMKLQQKIFKIIQRIARHSTSEADFDSYIVPILPFICMNLNADFGCDQKKIEDVSKIVTEMQESFGLFLSPINDFEKISCQYDKLLSHGVYDIILGHMRQVAEINHKLELEKAVKSAEHNQGSSLTNEAMLVDGAQISSSNNSQQISNQTILNFFRVLENGSRYSSTVANKLFGEGSLLKDLGTFLPHDFSGTQKQYNSEDFPFIMEIINLLSTVFSD